MVRKVTVDVAFVDGTHCAVLWPALECIVADAPGDVSVSENFLPGFVAPRVRKDPHFPCSCYGTGTHVRCVRVSKDPVGKIRYAFLWKHPVEKSSLARKREGLDEDEDYLEETPRRSEMEVRRRIGKIGGVDLLSKVPGRLRQKKVPTKPPTPLIPSAFCWQPPSGPV
ncbi:hypothetical protein MRX96_002547 [Rhipicephalus microplus]